MYDEGVGTNAIARFLDAVKLPTKRQGKDWDHSMVTAILKREGVYMEQAGLGEGKGALLHNSSFWLACSL